MKALTLVLPEDVLFNGEESEWTFFVAGWAFRVLSGAQEGAGSVYAKDHVPEATQDQRISWERGWMAADAVINLLVGKA